MENKIIAAYAGSCLYNHQGIWRPFLKCSFFHPPFPPSADHEIITKLNQKITSLEEDKDACETSSA